MFWRCIFIRWASPNRFWLFWSTWFRDNITESHWWVFSLTEIGVKRSQIRRSQIIWYKIISIVLFVDRACELLWLLCTRSHRWRTSRVKNRVKKASAILGSEWNLRCGKRVPRTRWLSLKGIYRRCKLNWYWMNNHFMIFWFSSTWGFLWCPISRYHSRWLWRSSLTLNRRCLTSSVMWLMSVFNHSIIWAKNSNEVPSYVQKSQEISILCVWSDILETLPVNLVINKFIPRKFSRNKACVNR